jgi:hypothetical protein
VRSAQGAGRVYAIKVSGANVARVAAICARTTSGQQIIPAILTLPIARTPTRDHPDQVHKMSELVEMIAESPGRSGSGAV